MTLLNFFQKKRSRKVRIGIYNMSVNKLDVLNIAGYKFEPLSDIDSLVQEFQSVCDDLELKGSVYLSPNGINFSLAGSEESIEQYIHIHRTR